MKVPVRIGNQVTHASHNIYSYKGLVFCMNCGYIASVKLVGLASKCNNTKTSKGQSNIDRIAKGLLPHGVHHWPYEV